MPLPLITLSCVFSPAAAAAAAVLYFFPPARIRSYTGCLLLEQMFKGQGEGQDRTRVKRRKVAPPLRT